MAKYTELLSEYIEHGGELPAVFDTIKGFTDLFIGKYCDKEIGFETPILFEIKLNAKANIVIPAYAQRIEELKQAHESLFKPVKERTKSGQIQREYGEQNSVDTETKTGEIKRGGTDTRTITNADHAHNEYDMPYVEQNEPTALTRKTVDVGYIDKEALEKNDNESYNNYEDKRTIKAEKHTDTESYNNYKETESGYTASEAQALYTALQNDIYNIIDTCLNEFQNLFMQVY